MFSLLMVHYLHMRIHSMRIVIELGTGSERWGCFLEQYKNHPKSFVAKAIEVLPTMDGRFILLTWFGLVRKLLSEDFGESRTQQSVHGLPDYEGFLSIHKSDSRYKSMAVTVRVAGGMKSTCLHDRFWQYRLMIPEWPSISGSGLVMKCWRRNSTAQLAKKL